MVGIDRNAGDIATGDGEMHRLPAFNVLEGSKRRYARRMAKRCRKGRKVQPKGLYRARAMHAKTCRKLRNGRRNQRHQTTAGIAMRRDVVVLEDLSLKAMTAEGRLEAGHEPLHAGHRLRHHGAVVRIQGRAGREGPRRLHQLDVLALWEYGRGLYTKVTIPLPQVPQTGASGPGR